MEELNILKKTVEEMIGVNKGMLEEYSSGRENSQLEDRVFVARFQGKVDTLGILLEQIEWCIRRRISK